MPTINSSDYAPTQYNLQIGGASGTLSNVAPSATSGVPFISQGAASNPVAGTIVVAGGGIGVVSTTAYAVQCGGTTSTNPFQSIASVGTAGQILAGNTGALPTFQSSASLGASWVLIQSQVASSSTTLVFTSNVSTYNTLLLIYSNVQPGTTNQALKIRISIDGGSTYKTTGYLAGWNNATYTSTSYGNANFTDGLSLGGNFTTGAGEKGSGFLYIQDVKSGAAIKAIGQGTLIEPSNLAMNFYVSNNTSFTGTNALQILFASGTISTGTFTLYGLKES